MARAADAPMPSVEASPGARRRTTLRRLAADGLQAFVANVPAAVCLGLLLIVWQIVVTALGVSDFILPTPLQILKVTIRFFPQLLRHTWTTTVERPMKITPVKPPIRASAKESGAEVERPMSAIAAAHTR